MSSPLARPYFPYKDTKKYGNEIHADIIKGSEVVCGIHICEGETVYLRYGKLCKKNVSVTMHEMF